LLSTEPIKRAGIRMSLRAPLNPHRSIDEVIDNLIVEIRRKLEATRYSQIGAASIAGRY
jgi:hypothetical protein